MTRRYNFGAGPSTLPLEVLEEARAEFVDYHGAGMALVEMSHRSPEYEAVHNRTKQLAIEVLDAPEEFDALFLQGGASLQFAMVPLNLLAGTSSRGAYIRSGSWGRKALSDGAHHGEVYAAWDGEPFGYTRMPAPDEMIIEPDTRYLHVTSNETIDGIRLAEWPEAEVPLVADVSSDFMTRSVPWDRFDLAYGGAQKNLGPAGVTIVFVRRSILAETNRDLASYLRYDIHSEKNSLYNTPPVFAIYMVGKVLAWMQGLGGLAAIEKLAEQKASTLYRVIDGSSGYFRAPAAPSSRSLMNVVFRLPTEELEDEFIEAATAAGMVGLRGHRNVGGCRASIYNAMPVAGVDALAQFMTDFANSHPPPP